MTLRPISLTRLVLSALALVAVIDVAAAQAEYQVTPRANATIARSALLAVRPAGDAALSNAAIDAQLNAFAAANSTNPDVQSALDHAASTINHDLARFINADGSTNTRSVAMLLTEQLGQAGRIVMPRVAIDNAAGTASLSSAKTISDMGDTDIMALAFIVMMDAAKSAREDLKNIMAGVKAINQQKQGLRAAANRLDTLSMNCAVNPGNCDGTGIAPGVLGVELPGQASKQDIDNAKETVKNKLDNLSEMGETESLRLQMAMDRLSKLMSTLSNLLKKESDTSSSIIQNIK